MIVREGGIGKSFQGAFSYYMHDKDHALTSERVDWAQAHNCSTDTPEFALHEMIHTAQNAQAIQLEHSGKKSPHKVLNSVYTFSLSWHKSETPTKEDMLEAGRSALKAVGLENRQHIVISHNDEAYKHIHIMVNRVDPVTGLIDHEKTTSKSKLKFSKWADNYERERGQNFCPQRRKNCLKRDNGEYVKYLDDGTHRQAKHEAQKAFKEQGWKDYSQEKQAEYKRLVGRKQKVLKIRLDALKKQQNFKGQWSDYYGEVRDDQKQQWKDNKKNVRKLKDVLANRYGIYKANLYDQRGLVTRPFNYHAGQTERKGKDGKTYKHVRSSRFIREKKEKLLQAQALERKKVIEQVNKEYAPRFENLQKARSIDQLKAVQRREDKRQEALIRINEKAQSRKHPKRRPSSESLRQRKNYNGKSPLKDQENQTTPTPAPRIHTTSQRRQTARYKLELRQRAELTDFEVRRAEQKSKEQDRLNAFYKPAEHQRKLREAERDLNKHQGMFSKVTGKTKALQKNVEDLKRNLESLEQTRAQTMRLHQARVSQERQALTHRHEQELEAFDKQPIQKTGTAKTFEKEVLRKEVANQNPQQRKTPTPETGSVNPPFKKAVSSHETEAKSTANDNTKTETKARTRNRSKDRKPRKERTRSRERQP